MGGTLSVINGANNSVIATIPVGNNPDGIAVDTRTDIIYVSNWGSILNLF
ncbi:MAG: YncE family protein [Athalassotoga sp.]